MKTETLAEKILGRYFLVFIFIMFLFTVLFVRKILSEGGYVSLATVAIGAFFGGGAIKSVGDAISNRVLANGTAPSVNDPGDKGQVNG